MSALIRAYVLSGYRELVGELGGDAAALLEQFGIQVAEADLPGAFIPYASVLRLFEATAPKLGCADFGLRLSQLQGLHSLGPLALLVTHCKTVREGLHAIGRYMPTYSPAVVISLDESGPRGAQLVYDVNLRVAGVPRRQQKNEFSLGVAMNVLRLLVGERFKADAVLFRHDSEPPASRYQRYFGVTPRFGQPVNAIVMNRAYLDQPLALSDRRLRGMVDEYLQPLIERQPVGVEQQVEQLIAKLLPTQQCRLSTIAAHLSMHERTLQRHLESSGRVFEKMVDEVRRERALEYLANPRILISQTASLIGYSEQSTFTRACRRWFRDSPRGVRQSLQKDTAGTAAQPLSAA